ncbi:MAG TPA: hypothetical protein PKW79_03345 [Rhabdochlamydiaceae bacterium]|nr:hypothetical protein [Rhabdochlamydiaceae bacterium]
MNPDQNSSVFFNREMNLSLKIEAEGNQAEIPAGNIEKISLELHTYGFVGTLQFSGVDNDMLDILFTSKKETKITLTFQSSDPLQMETPLLEIKGIVVQKFFTRVDERDTTTPLSVRHYEIVITDNAQATWSEHRPTNIYVDESMKKVLEEHKNPAISIEYDFYALDKKHPIIAFSLASNGSLPLDEQDHFYSFLTWYLFHEGGIWYYDYKTHKYAILGKKIPLDGVPYSIKDYWIAPPTVTLQNPPRYNIDTLKHSAESLDRETKEHETAYKSVRHDVITPTNYRSFPEHAHEPIHSSLNREHPEIEIEAMQLESDFDIDKLVPGSYITIFSTGNTWSSDSFYQGKVFRSRALMFEAYKMGRTEKLQKPTQTYQIYVKAILESKEETYIERPYFMSPVFPFTIQGKIVSDIGDMDQSTYKISKNEHNPQGQYLVSIPLVEQKRVVVPFTPDFLNGQYYFPYCKGESVLLSMYFHTAKVQRVIDWQPLARLPAGVQGNQIVLSSNGKDKYAIIKHEFEGGSNSVITIKQATSSTQTQTVKIIDKNLMITVDEKDKKTLIIHLNGDQGLTLSLQDKTGQMTQQIVFDGHQIISTCKNSGDTSTYTQTPDSVTINCKQFNVNSENIILTAKDSIVQNGEGKVDIETALANIKAGSVKLG